MKNLPKELTYLLGEPPNHVQYGDPDMPLRKCFVTVIRTLEYARSSVSGELQAYVEYLSSDGARRFVPLESAIATVTNDRNCVIARTVSNKDYRQNIGIKRREHLGNLFHLLGYFVTQSLPPVDIIAGSPVSVKVQGRRTPEVYVACFGVYPDKRIPQDTQSLVLIRADTLGLQRCAESGFVEKSQMLLVSNT